MANLESKVLSFRPPEEVLERIDALVRLTTNATGITVRRGGVALDAILIGLTTLEARAAAANVRSKRVRS